MMASKNLDDVSEKLILGQQTAFLAQKSAPAASPWPAMFRSQHKKVVFLVSCHDGIKNIRRCLQNIDFEPKNCILAPNRAILAIRGLIIAPQAVEWAGQLPEHQRYPELPQYVGKL